MKLHRITRAATLALAIAALAAAPAAARQTVRPTQDLRNPDTVDYAQGRGTYNTPKTIVVRVPETAQPAGDGIDWGDVGIGAAGLLGVSLITTGGALVVVQRRHGRMSAQT
jgi:hypothetical protein